MFSQIVNVDIVAVDLVSYNVKFVNNNCNLICFSELAIGNVITREV